MLISDCVWKQQAGNCPTPGLIATLANDNNNPALTDFPSVTRVFMQRYYYFFAYLLCLIVALSTHDAHTAPEDTIPETFGFTDQIGIKGSTSDSISGGVNEIDNRIAGLKPSY